MGWAAIATAQDDESTRLETYLTSLKLDRLVIQQLEHQVAIELDRERRISMARRLVNLYTDKLLNLETDANHAAHWVNKASALIKVYPDLDNPRLRIASLQSRFLTAERNFLDRQNLCLFSEAAGSETGAGTLSNWLLLERDLFRFDEQLEARYQELVTAIQVSGKEPELLQELHQSESILLHANFLLGWTNYYCGVLQPDLREIRLRQSDEFFREFFQIESRKSLTEFSAKWFDFNSNWQIRGLVGLAMCQRGLNHPQQSEYCFELLERHASKTTRERLPIWRLNSRLYLDQYESAGKCIEEFDRQSLAPTPLQVSFWTTVLAASLNLQSAAPELATRFERAGLRGLVRNSQASLIETFLERRRSINDHHDSNPPAEYQLPDDFLGNWVQGYLELYRAENNSADRASPDTQQLETDTKTTLSTRESTLHTAREYLETALLQTDVQTLDADLARCRFLLASIDFRERRFETAAEFFNQVVAVIIATDPELAAEAQWYVAQSMIELNRQTGRYSANAYSALEVIRRRFPGSDFAKRSEFETLRLNLISLPDEEAVHRLERIPSTDANYLSALIEIARHRFQLWLDAFEENAPDRDTKFDALVASVQALQDQPGIRVQQQLAATFLVVDALLRVSPLDTKMAEHYLELADRMVVQLPAANFELAAEYHYFQMQLAEKTEQPNIAQQHARWIVDNGLETRFELPALVCLGQLLEIERQRPDPHSEMLMPETLKTFRRLVEILGSTPEQLQRLKNAQVALATLAELEKQTKQFEQAARRYEQLVAGFPNQQQYLYGLATCKMQLHDYPSAAPIWSKLSVNAKAGTDDWYEAKHELIVCLLSTDRESAEKLYRQTLRLGGEFPESWRAKFDLLGTKLEKQPITKESSPPNSRIDDD